MFAASTTSLMTHMHGSDQAMRDGGRREGRGRDDDDFIWRTGQRLLACIVVSGRLPTLIGTAENDIDMNLPGRLRSGKALLELRLIVGMSNVMLLKIGLEAHEGLRSGGLSSKNVRLQSLSMDLRVCLTSTIRVDRVSGNQHANRCRDQAKSVYKCINVSLNETSELQTSEPRQCCFGLEHVNQYISSDLDNSWWYVVAKLAADLLRRLKRSFATKKAAGVD